MDGPEAIVAAMGPGELYADGKAGLFLMASTHNGLCFMCESLQRLLLNAAVWSSRVRGEEQRTRYGV